MRTFDDNLKLTKYLNSYDQSMIGFIVKNKLNLPVGVGALVPGHKRAMMLIAGVLPRYRRLGIWKALIALRMAYARSHGIHVSW